MASHDENYVDPEELDPAEVIGPPRALIERAEQLLTQVERAGPKLSPADCINLFASVGDLRFTNWDSVEILWTPQRRRKVDEACHELYGRLQAQIGSHSEALLDNLEAGIRDLVGKITTGLEQHEEIRRTYADPWDYNTSYEFLDYVIFPLDTLGYVLELMRDLRIEPGERTTASVARLDQTVRSSLPEIADEYRRGGDPIDTVVPDVYPESFWWKRLPRAKPIV